MKTWNKNKKIKKLDKDANKRTKYHCKLNLDNEMKENEIEVGIKREEKMLSKQDKYCD